MAKKYCKGITLNGTRCTQPIQENELCSLHLTVYGLVQKTMANPKFQVGLDTVINYVANTVTKPFNKKKATSEVPDVAKARLILNFKLDEPLTIEKIKERRKKLATLFHPDQNSADTTEQMQQVNWACEVLLATVK